MIGQLSRDARPDGRGGIELYRGWSAGMTLGDAYARIKRDGLAYSITVPDAIRWGDLVSSRGKNFYVQRMLNSSEISQAVSYDPDYGRYDFTTGINLKAFDYPDRAPQKSAKGLEIGVDFLLPHSMAGSYSINLQDGVLLRFTKKQGLFAVEKAFPKGTKKETVVEALQEKYGPSDSKYQKLHSGLGHEKPYATVRGDLCVFFDGVANFVDRTFDGVAYFVDRKTVDAFFAAYGKLLDEKANRKNEAEQKVRESIL